MKSKSGRDRVGCQVASLPSSKSRFRLRAARAAPPKRKGEARKLGVLDGQFRIPDDFNAPLPPELLRAFLGGR